MKLLLKKFLPFIIFIFVIIVAPFALRSEYIVSTMSVIGIYVLLSSSMCLVVGYAGQFTLAHPVFFGIGAYTSAILVTTYSWPPATALLVAPILSGLIAYGMGYPLFRLGALHFACATFCILIIFQTCVTELRIITGGANGISGIPMFSIGSFVIEGRLTIFYSIWLVVVISTILSFNIVNSKVGRALQAISVSENAASTCGVNVAKCKVGIFTFSAVIASIAGSIYAHYLSFVGPDTFGFSLLLDLLAIIIIGGMRSIWGAIIGTATFIALGEIFRELLSSQPYIGTIAGEITLIFWGIIVIFLLIFMPGGVVQGGAEILKFVVARAKTMITK